MISIIICSINAALCEKVKANIALTIGVAYEVIVIENTTNSLNISQAYNAGAFKAIYPYVCFVHEDVLFHTQEWGQNVVNHFNSDPAIGLIGIAGSAYKSAAPSAWFPNMNLKTCIPVFKNIRQHHYDGLIRLEYENPCNELRSGVVVIDGVWMCCKRSLWNKVKFDEKLINGFHCYDIDFSIAVATYAKVAVIYDILLEHFSPGSYSKAWLEDTYRLHKKWKWRLPLNLLNLRRDIYFKYECECRNDFINLMYDNLCNPIKIFNVIWAVGSFRFFYPAKFLLWNINLIRYSWVYYKF